MHFTRHGNGGGGVSVCPGLKAGVFGVLVTFPRGLQCCTFKGCVPFFVSQERGWATGVCIMSMSGSQLWRGSRMQENASMVLN